MRCDPTALHATANVLTSIAFETPPSSTSPPSGHPVSVAAAAQLNTHATNVAAMITHASALAARGSATYTASAYDYTNTDAEYAATIANAFNSVTDMLTGTATPPVAAESAPSVPIPPHPTAPVDVPHPPDPTVTPAPADTAATALRSGDQGASLAAATQTWRTIAATLTSHQQNLQTAIAGLQTSWEGSSATAAITRLQPFAAWFTDAAAAATAVASHAERIATAHHQAVASHPTAETVSQLRQGFATASAQAAAGNLSAAAVAADYREQLTNAQTTSTQVLQTYASHASVPAALLPSPPSPATPGVGAGSTDNPDQGRGKLLDNSHEKPQAAGDIDTDSIPDAQHAVKTRPANTLADGNKLGIDETTSPAPIRPLDTPLTDEISAPLSPMPMIAGLGQSIGQAGQMPSSMSPPQMPQMPTSPPMPPTPPLSPAGGQLPPAAPPVSPANTSGPVPPIPPLTGGGGGAGAGGGSPSLGGVAPATALPTNPAPTTGAGTSGAPATGVAAGMPMGMMPHGQGSGKEKERDPNLAADEPIYTEDRPHTTAFIDGAIGPPPPPEIKEQQQP